MAVLVPAILTKDAEEVIEKIQFLESVPEITDVQIDFEDGQFVPNTTVLPADLQLPETRLNLEAHMMVNKPQNYLHDLERLKVKSVIFHHESFSVLEGLLAALENAKALGFVVGVAINPETEVTVFDGFIDKINIAMVMSVYPGFQGRPFLPESLERVSALRRAHENAIIEVDGGLNLRNFEQAVAHGANRVAVGSGIWQTPDAKKTIHEFLAKLK